MKLEALNGFLRANPRGTENPVSLQGGHSSYGSFEPTMEMLNGPLLAKKLIKNKLKRKLNKAERMKKRKARRLARRGGDQSAQRSMAVSKKGNLVSGGLAKLSKVNLNGSEAGFIRNAVGGSGMSVENLNGLALQGKAERRARRKKKQEQRQAKRDRKQELKTERKENR